MTSQRVYVLGSGAVGLPLAAFLARQGRAVTPVRLRDREPGVRELGVRVRDRLHSPPERVTLASSSLTDFETMRGVVVIAAKSHANEAIAAALRRVRIEGPLVILQNGLGVEAPFLDLSRDVMRGVLYLSSQPEPAEEHAFLFRRIASSPLGVVQGTAGACGACVEVLSTPSFPFHVEADIGRCVWEKTIINAVFNSICPLLEADNGIFARDAESAALAEEVVAEGVRLAARQSVALSSPGIMEKVFAISRGSDGGLISTLQDIRSGRATEIASLNLELARIAEQSHPPVPLPQTAMLGRLTALKARLGLRAGKESGV